MTITPPFVVVPMTAQHAEAISSWRYEPPYDVYNSNSWDQLVVDSFEMGDDFIREQQYRAVLDGYEHKLVGFAQFFPLKGVIRLGLGMHPVWRGQGLGTAFVQTIAAYAADLSPGSVIDLEVSTWNKHARHVYERAGFMLTDTYERPTPTGVEQFHCMVLSEDCSFSH